MMNENSSEPIETPGAALSLAGVGRILTQAREQAGLTCDEAAARLRLSPRQVSALESGNMDALPGPAFVRGFIRNYAKLLQIDAEPLLEACRTYAPDAKQAHISLHTENILIEGRERKSWQSYLIVAAVVGAVLAGWMWYMSYQGKPQAPAEEAAEATAQEQPLPLFGETAPAAPAQTESAPAAAEPMPPAPADVTSQPAPAVPPAAEPAAAVPQHTAPSEAAPPPTAASPAPAAARLKLNFTETGWVSIRDRDGKEIFNKTVSAGGSELVEGMPPFKIVLGNATGMQVIYNDAPVDLALHTKGNVARFTLD